MAEQPSTTPTEAKADAGESRQRTFLIIGVVVAILIVLAILVGLTILAIQHPAGTASIRDVTIIVAAVMTVVIALVLIYLIYELAMLFLLLRDEIKPLLVSINETMNTVRGTTEFMSENVVQPTIRVSSTFSGVMRAVQVLAGIRSSVRPKQRKE